MRDYSGARGPVPGTYRAHDWQTCREMREAADAYRAKREWRERAKVRTARIRASEAWLAQNPSSYC